MSRKGTVISCVLTAIMTYFGNRLDFAVTVARAAEVDVFVAFRAMGNCGTPGTSMEQPMGVI